MENLLLLQRPSWLSWLQLLTNNKNKKILTHVFSILKYFLVKYNLFERCGVCWVVNDSFFPFPLLRTCFALICHFEPILQKSPSSHKFNSTPGSQFILGRSCGHIYCLHFVISANMNGVRYLFRLKQLSEKDKLDAKVHLIFSDSIECLKSRGK